jgi:hypothetical protein
MVVVEADLNLTTGMRIWQSQLSILEDPACLARVNFGEAQSIPSAPRIERRLGRFSV